MERPRAVVVHYDPVTRKELSRALGDTCEVVGESGTGEDALGLMRESEAELALVSADLERGDGMSLTRAVRQLMPMTHIILLTSQPNEGQLFEAIRYGASAYLPEDTPADDLRDTVGRVAAGQYVIDDNILGNPRLASRVLDAFRTLSRAEQGEGALFAPLSPREIQVLEHAAHGSSNKVIARKMGISDQTVKNHLTSIMRKLAVNDRTQAVVYALQHGWIHVRDV
jgi:two-component system, NarL family, response regulator DegU